MIIHTSLTMAQMHDALPDGVAFDQVFASGSRTHPRKFAVRLTGSGYRVNSGNRGAGDLIGATWDEWGLFLAHVFDADPGARAGAPPYNGRNHYHAVTGYRFAGQVMPADTHRRHRWTRDGARRQRCTGCTASIDWNLLSHAV